jgi:ABC-type polysaccharide/polyol phosphate transport system ATPase subunit
MCCERKAHGAPRKGQGAEGKAKDPLPFAAQCVAMSMYAIEVRGLSKVYRLYRRPIDRLKEAVLRRPFHQPFESLKDVSFLIPSGSALGVIGENGAGKSTLLKMLAGTLTPTSGEVVRRGRTAALLELGAGFHPEFTGRQNIYLNASLLGLRDQEIREREEDIIDFAELGQFIDRPLKIYSSGMKMRLAFSVATTVNPDILIIDEALSVGDQRFQEKCVDRIVKFRKEGKTILVCSHSMYMINELCSRTMWLANGRVSAFGETPGVIAEYMAYMEEKIYGGNGSQKETGEKNVASPDVRIEEIRLVGANGEGLQRGEQFQPLILEVKTHRTGPPLMGHMAITIEQTGGQLIFAGTTKESGIGPISYSGDQTTRFVMPSMPLVGGRFVAKAMVGDEHTLRLIDQMKSPSFLIEGKRPELGMLWMEHHWQLPETDSDSADHLAMG